MLNRTANGPTATREMIITHTQKPLQHASIRLEVLYYQKWEMVFSFLGLVFFFLIYLVSNILCMGKACNLKGQLFFSCGYLPYKC